MEGLFTRALERSLDEASRLLFREGTPERRLGWALVAWASTFGAMALELPIAAVALGPWLERFRGDLPGLARFLVPIGCLALAGGVALAWLRANGLMTLLDCLVRREGGARDAWRRQRRNANRLVLMWLGIGACAVVFAGVLGGGWWCWFRGRALGWGTLGANDALALGAVCAVGAVGIALFVAAGCLVEDFFGAFLIAGEGSGMRKAVARVCALVWDRGDIVLAYLGMRMCLALVATSVALAAGSLLCGVVFLPYFGALLLLPVHVVWRLYPLFVLREVGFDPWAGGKRPRVIEVESVAKPPRLRETPARVPPRLR